jgi:uncharacterized membrane protein
MHKSRLSSWVIGLFLVLFLVAGFMASPVSAEDTPLPTPELKMKCDVPSYSDNSGSTFSYAVDLTYSGNDTVTVVLSVKNPNGWTTYLTYSSKEVTSLPIGPLSYGTPDSKALSISFSPQSGNTPDPGEYTMTVKATAGQLSASIDLTAVVKAKYDMTMTTSDGKLNTTASAGKDNHLSFQLKNTGSADLTDTSFYADTPSGWNVKFSPDTIATMSAGQTQQVDITITPPGDKTVAGDYMVTFRANNAKFSRSLDIRTTVETSSIWGIVSIIIIVVVIIGLAILFLRLGRR